MPEDVAIQALAELDDDDLFEKLAEGIQLLSDNLNRLDTAARQVSDAGDGASASVLRHFATEEAAKVLILLDVVRCPLTEQQARERVLGRWTNHLWKGIYAAACAWSPVDFDEVRRHVEHEFEWYYLDGPFEVDWIFPNQIVTARERLVYVDYVRDLTQDPQKADEWWTSPDTTFSRHPTNPCVLTVQALCKMGVGTVGGLSIIAELWRRVVPELDLHRTDVGGYIQMTANRLYDVGIVSQDWMNESRRHDVLNWPFPLWSLEPKPAQRKARLESLREERRDKIKRIAEMEKQRDPPPAISEEQVLRMHEAYLDRKAAEDQRSAELDKRPRRDRAGFPRTLSSSDMDFIYDVNAPEYLRLRDMWRNLSREEQIALLALAWFTRHNVEDWPHDYQDAKKRFDTVEEHYHLGCAHEWLEGYRRWKGEQIHPWRLPSV